MTPRQMRGAHAVSVPNSLRELAIVTGLTRGQVRSGVDVGLVDPMTLSWVDALALRVQLPVQTMVLAGESQPRNMTKAVRTRTREAVRVVREAAVADRIERDAVLVVGRATASVQSSLAAAAAEVESTVYTDGVLLALPIGQWWSEVRWRRLAGDLH